MFKGNEKISGGRVGDDTSIPLSKRLYELKLPMGRLKTGTPPRIKLSSIDLNVMEEQPGDKNPPFMSVLHPPQKTLPQISCHITRTNKTTHKIIADNTHLSAMYSGQISGIGPRYCPSIEDKINKFSEKDSHQIFIEPEGLEKNLVYPNGISTSLPALAQKEWLASFANSVIQIAGPLGSLQRGAKWAAKEGWNEQFYRRYAFDTHGHGTPELLRMIIATRGLGLPRY